MRLVHFGVETRLGRLVLRHGFRTRVGRDGWVPLPVSPAEAARQIGVPLLVVHGDRDGYFGLEHARMLAAAAPRAELWVEAGMGHAEAATTMDLVDRIDDWCRAATGTSARIEP
jgi:pimeloyl-ACP methyl ester carboxylesterase